MTPIILKTKYAFHSLLWLINPDLVMDIGSMDGADSVRFHSLLKKTDLVAFEANPLNYANMCADKRVGLCGIRVVNKLISGTIGTQPFYIQRPAGTTPQTNRGTGSAIPRNEIGMENVEVQIDSVRIDTFLEAEFPNALNIALWVDVEGFAYEVLGSLEKAADRISLIHVEAETRECWPGQQLEPEVVQLLTRMGFVMLAHGKHDIQRDLLFIRSDLYISRQLAIDFVLQFARWAGPALSRILSLFPRQKHASIATEL